MCIFSKALAQSLGYHKKSLQKEIELFDQHLLPKGFVFTGDLGNSFDEVPDWLKRSTSDREALVLGLSLSDGNLLDGSGTLQFEEDAEFFSSNCCFIINICFCISSI